MTVAAPAVLILDVMVMWFPLVSAAPPARLESSSEHTSGAATVSGPGESTAPPYGGRMQMTELSTARLTLRVPVERDAASIAAAWQDPAIQRWLGVPVPSDTSTARRYIDTIVTPGWADRTALTWSVIEHREVVGLVWVDAILDGTGRIGFWTAPGQRGRGLLTEAATRVLDACFSPSGGLHRIEWRAFAGNTASARSAQRLGFRFEGALRSGALGRHGREDEWLASLLATDRRAPVPWPEGVLGPTSD
jgi:RimJ/RimL family protein N-acetyltransferase